MGTRMKFPGYPSNREADESVWMPLLRKGVGRRAGRMTQSRETCLHRDEFPWGWDMLSGPRIHMLSWAYVGVPLRGGMPFFVAAFQHLDAAPPADSFDLPDRRDFLWKP